MAELAALFAAVVIADLIKPPQQLCLTCHGPDPAQDGPVAPAIKGAARELLEARIRDGAYPPGYRPKRPTKVMPPMPAVAWGGAAR